MRNDGKFSVLGTGVCAVDYDYVVDRVIRAASARQSLKVSALAVHGLMTGVFDRAQRWRLNSFDLIVPDGQPVRWALNWLNNSNLDKRVYGPELMLRVCRRAADSGIPVYFYGNRSEVLTALVSKLRTDIPDLKIAGYAPSLFRKVTEQEKAVIISRIQDSRAGVVFVGLGCPRQEVFAYEYGDHLQCPTLAVGAAFNICAGFARQAPPWMQRRGLEWLFRLIHDPVRLWRRYLLLNPYFLMLLALQLSGFHGFADIGEKPDEDVGFA
jgi:exopolysaccharide biosynthesis WecB/TagA/CpsF family protein